jgi:hypothetical protein
VGGGCGLGFSSPFLRRARDRFDRSIRPGGSPSGAERRGAAANPTEPGMGRLLFVRLSRAAMRRGGRRRNIREGAAWESDGGRGAGPRFWADLGGVRAHERAQGGEVSARFGLVGRIFGGTCVRGVVSPPAWQSGWAAVGSSRRPRGPLPGEEPIKRGGSPAAAERPRLRRNPSPRPPRSQSTNPR